MTEDDEARIRARNKQIDFGKNTRGYERYVTSVPKNCRERANPNHPQTPNPYKKCSKRSFDFQLRNWRRLLHQWDPPSQDESEIDFEALASDHS